MSNLRAEHLIALADEYHSDVDDACLATLDRWVLIEHHQLSGEAFLSLHPHPAAALHYNADQEDADRWQPVTLVDLDTGVHHPDPVAFAAAHQPTGRRQLTVVDDLDQRVVPTGLRAADSDELVDHYLTLTDDATVAFLPHHTDRELSWDVAAAYNAACAAKEGGAAGHGPSLRDELADLHAAIVTDDPDTQELSAADQCAWLYEILGRHGMPVS